MKIWKKTPKGIASRRRQRSTPENKEKFKKYYRKWYSEHGRDRAVDYAEAVREWEKRNPEKISAHGKVKYALKVGKIIKPKFCMNCQRETRLSGHHRDYTKPLEVLWLCSSCHKLEHSKSHLTTVLHPL